MQTAVEQDEDGADEEEDGEELAAAHIAPPSSAVIKRTDSEKGWGKAFIKKADIRMMKSGPVEYFQVWYENYGDTWVRWDKVSEEMKAAYRAKAAALSAAVSEEVP